MSNYSSWSPYISLRRSLSLLHVDSGAWIRRFMIDPRSELPLISIRPFSGVNLISIIMPITDPLYCWWYRLVSILIQLVYSTEIWPAESSHHEWLLDLSSSISYIDDDHTSVFSLHVYRLHMMDQNDIPSIWSTFSSTYSHSRLHHIEMLAYRYLILSSI